MRDLTKSILSFSWAMPLFGMRQMMEMTMPRDPSRPFGRVTESFDALTQATTAQMGDAWRGAFRAGDQLQRGIVDMMFSFFSMDALNPNRMMQTSADVMQRSMAAVGQMRGNCGCGPADVPGSDTAAPPAGWGPTSTGEPYSMPSATVPPAGWKVATPTGL